MIPKLICKLFGHITWEKVFSGEYAKQYYPLTGQMIDVPVCYRHYVDKCPRCGKLIKS